MCGLILIYNIQFEAIIEYTYILTSIASIIINLSLMDTHHPHKLKNISQTPKKPSNDARPRQRQQTSTEKALISSKKHSNSSVSKKKSKEVQLSQKDPSFNQGQHEASLLYLNEEGRDDSDFEFSAEIMENNPRKETRQTREKGKYPHLTIYDWMMRVSTLLKLSKECFYRSIIIMKKFMFLDQKESKRKVGRGNVNIYGLAALLISSKFQNISGNFLANISHVADENSGQINKKCILQCEIYIMSTMHFQVGNCSIIIESIMAVLDAWKQAIFSTNLEIFTFSRFEQIENYEGQEERMGIEGQALLQKCIYLVDFVLMRRVVDLKVKDIKSVDNHSYFRRIIANVLLHLISYLISRLPQQMQAERLRSYRKAVRQLSAKLGITKQQQSALQRKSHLLGKEIRSIFNNSSQKGESLKKIASKNDQMVKNYCLCKLRATSSKFAVPESLQKQGNTSYPESLNKRDDEYDTVPITFQPASRLLTEEIPVNKQSLGKNRTVKNKERPSLCANCVKSTGLLREVINQQFYVPLLVCQHK